MDGPVWAFAMNIHEHFNTWHEALLRKMTLKVTNVLLTKMSREIK
jgi:hypothetical protein